MFTLNMEVWAEYDRLLPVNHRFLPVHGITLLGGNQVFTYNVEFQAESRLNRILPASHSGFFIFDVMCSVSNNHPHLPMDCSGKFSEFCTMALQCRRRRILYGL